MEDATRLIGDLHKKLAHLDDQVAAYRQEMASEFRRYSHQLLQDIPEDVSAEVERSVAKSLPFFPALGPELQTSADSPLPANADTAETPGHEAITTTTTSSPSAASVAAITDDNEARPSSGASSTPPHSKFLAKQTPGSPPPLDHRSDPVSTNDSTVTSPTHESEVELRGLFTPAYLPLLDSSPALPSPTSPTSETSPISPPAPMSSQLPTKGGMDKKGDDGKDKADRASPASNATLTPNRPFHVRKGTDDTTSSCASDHGESGKVRRSALRRSSSGPKPSPSPRRVRFEFEGGEVLPTSSPGHSDVSLAQSHSLHVSGGPAHQPEPPKEVDPLSAEAILGPDEDSEPPPKKVSSSQALRALSRTPLDTNTVWTVVNAGSPEPGDSPRGTPSPASSKSSLADHAAKAAPAVARRSSDVGQPPEKASPQRSKKVLKSPPPERNPDVQDDDDDDKDKEDEEEEEEERDENGNEDDDDDDDDSSDDDFLAMAKPKSFANKKSLRSPLSRSPTGPGTSPPSSSHPHLATPDPSSLPVKSTPAPKTALTRTKSKERVAMEVGAEEEEDGLFEFEGGPPRKTPSAPVPVSDDDEVAEVEEIEDQARATTDHTTAFSTSPAITIPNPEPPLPHHLMSGSVGSFKGRSVNMPVVTDPDVYAQAASLGDVNSFIGGLDGRTGADEGDLASYRASVGQAAFTGTPRSMTERLMMEDAHKQRRIAAERRQP